MSEFCTTCGHLMAVHANLQHGSRYYRVKTNPENTRNLIVLGVGVTSLCNEKKKVSYCLSCRNKNKTCLVRGRAYGGGKHESDYSTGI